MESSTATNSSFPAKLTINDFAVQAAMVAVESSLDVGNILWMFYDCLYSTELSIYLIRARTVILWMMKYLILFIIFCIVYLCRYVCLLEKSIISYDVKICKTAFVL